MAVVKRTGLCLVCWNHCIICGLNRRHGLARKLESIIQRVASIIIPGEGWITIIFVAPLFLLYI
jgi:hypothetical protein